MSDNLLNITSKLPDTGVTIFSVMSKLAQEHQAINLSQGFPGFDIDKQLLNKANYYMSRGLNQYAPMPGAPELRKRVSRIKEELYKRYYDPSEEITITAGGTQGIFTSIMAFVREGDEVILFEPAYDCYAPAVKLAGGNPVYCQLKAPEYAIPWQDLTRRINHKTKMIIINNPHNPCGTVWSEDDISKLERITRDTSIIILSDEVYEHIVFDNKKHNSVSSLASLSERSIVIGSFGKTLHATGWKLGYVAAPGNLSAEIRKVHQYNVFSCNTPLQYAIADYLEDPNTYCGLSEFYQKKRDFFIGQLTGSKFQFKPAEGSYFQLLNYSAISKENDVEVAREWTINKGIASIPISVFYHNNLNEFMLRFCFAKDEELLMKAALILRNIE
jgi:methionine aminotransferase